MQNENKYRGEKEIEFFEIVFFHAELDIDFKRKTGAKLATVLVFNLLK